MSKTTYYFIDFLIVIRCAYVVLLVEILDKEIMQQNIISHWMLSFDRFSSFLMSSFPG